MPPSSRLLTKSFWRAFGFWNPIRFEHRMRFKLQAPLYGEPTYSYRLTRGNSRPPKLQA